MANSSEKKRKVDAECKALSDKEKTLIAKLWETLARRGMKKTEILEIFQQSGYDVKDDTVYRWRARVREEGVIKRRKEFVHQTKASEQMIRILVGHVLQLNENSQQVTRKTGRDFLYDYFRVLVSEETIGNYFKNSAIVLRAAKQKSTTTAVQPDFVSLYIEFINSLPRNVRTGDETIGSIDFVYTSHRNSRPKTFQALASPMGKVNVPKSRYTNCLLTLSYSSGFQSQCMCFTYNVKFKKLPGDSVHVKRHNNDLEKLSTKYDIDLKRVVYWKPPKGKDSLYMRECHEMVTEMTELYDFPCKRIHSDNGAAFKVKGVDVLESHGYRRFTSPAPIHQWVSVNDNSMHGVAKTRWRKARKNFANDVEATFHLMHLMDIISHENIKEWFKRNFCIGNFDVKKEHIRKIIGHTTGKNSKFWAECRKEYNNATKEKPLSSAKAENELAADLDGKYWKK